MTIRCFVAIDPPQNLRKGLAGLLPEERGVRRVTAAQMHLTLAFLGDVEEAGVPAVSEALARLCSAPFELVVSGGGSFGRAVLWAGVGGEVEALHRLAGEVREAMTAIGFELDPRPYHPHLTLARVRKGAGRASHAAVQCLGELGAFRVDEVLLYQSELRPEGARYTVLSRHPL